MADGDTDGDVRGDAGGAGYDDDMEYLKDGFEVVQEVCKVFLVSCEEQRGGTVLEHEAPRCGAAPHEVDAKIWMESALFSRRRAITNATDSFTSRLELLVDKLRLRHFELMVILTLGTIALSC